MELSTEKKTGLALMSNENSRIAVVKDRLQVGVERQLTGAEQKQWRRFSRGRKAKLFQKALRTEIVSESDPGYEAEDEEWERKRPVSEGKGVSYSDTVQNQRETGYLATECPPSEPLKNTGERIEQVSKRTGELSMETAQTVAAPGTGGTATGVKVTRRVIREFQRATQKNRYALEQSLLQRYKAGQSKERREKEKTLSTAGKLLPVAMMANILLSPVMAILMTLGIVMAGFGMVATVIGGAFSNGVPLPEGLVNQPVSSAFSEEEATALLQEALKYEGFRYSWGGERPETSFDCSGLTRWCYGTIGIDLPHSAQGQFDMTEHIDLADAAVGDLVFFTGTYPTAKLVTHVGIYVGNNTMYDAGDPIGFHDLNSSYNRTHYICCGRIIR